MKKNFWLWTLALLITLAIALFQRMSGPTYPISGSVLLNDVRLHYKLHRSHGGPTDHTVSIAVPDSLYKGVLAWKRYKTDDLWTLQPLNYQDGRLTGSLPHQPPAGKLMYQVTVEYQGKSLTFPEEPAIIRFKGDVPSWALILHVIFMFAGMLISTRAGLEVFATTPRLTLYAWLTVMLLFAGGLVLGPIVQKYAFDAYWTGWPFGTDLTDNKTIAAFIVWLIAALRIPYSPYPKRWAFAAAIVLLIVYLIPHSLLGSELDYSKLPQQ